MVWRAKQGQFILIPGDDVQIVVLLLTLDQADIKFEIQYALGDRTRIFYSQINARARVAIHVLRHDGDGQIITNCQCCTYLDMAYFATLGQQIFEFGGLGEQGFSARSETFAEIV